MQNYAILAQCGIAPSRVMAVFTFLWEPKGGTTCLLLPGKAE